MKKKMSFLILVVSLLSTYGSETASLRAYGKVSASFGPDSAEFICENEDKADMLLGKLLADLFWDAEAEHKEKNLTVQGKLVPIHLFQPYGTLCLYRDKTRVVAIGADTEKELMTRLQSEAGLKTASPAFIPSKPYPAYLDFYDLKSFRAYTHAMDSMRKTGLESHAAFVKEFGLGGIAFQGVGGWGRSPAESVLQICDADYEVREAEKNGYLAVPCPGMGEVALWAHNKNPGRMKQASPTALLGAWGDVGATGAHFESAGIPESVNAQNISLVMKRYMASPALGGWHPYAGSPGAEMGMHDRTGDWWDYSPAGLEGFRKWLREVKGYSLESLGKAWGNGSGAFKSWNDVLIPDALGFYGELDSEAFALNDTWFWRKAAVEEIQFPDADAKKWAAFRLPPSQKEMFFPWGDAFYKTGFDATAWISKNKGKPIYLVCSPYIRTKKNYQVWLNGEAIASLPGGGNPEAFSVEVREKLSAGKNELVIRIPSGKDPNSEGKILGPAFLTTAKPEKYPYLGLAGNTRYVDLKEWQAYAVYQTHSSVLASARALDPDRPMILSPGSSLPVADYANEFGAKFGMGVQHTGREAWYHPWWPGYGLVAGFYGTSEPSATARGETLTRLLGWITFDGDSAHTLFWDIEDYILEEKTNGWFTKNKRNIRLFGKDLREKPSIVLFRTAKNALLGVESIWRWDVGRGELQNAHFDNAYATERELSLGLLKDFPVLMDCGNEIFDEKMSQDLARYVREGGTFIAFHNTALHGTVKADSYPLGPLFGFKVAAKGKRGKIRFEKNAPLLKGWSDKEFEGEGIALDYLGNDYAKDAGLGLEATDPASQTLARWEDGSTAVGYRKVGKGAVIVLGSTFWRSGRDSKGLWKTSGEIEKNFFESLFGELGVKKNADASKASVWARKFHTKNGLQDWVVAFNSENTAAKSDVSFRPASKPAELWNLQTKQKVAFEAGEDGWVTVRDVELEGYGLAVFGSKRASLVGGLPTWWKEKTTYWRKTEVAAQEPTRLETKSTVIGIDTWQFLADQNGEVSASGEWRTGEPSGPWKNLRTGPWNYQSDELKTYTGIGLYRAKVNFPSDWSGKKIILGLYSWNTPIAYNEAEFFLNGKSVATYKAKTWSQTFNYDVSEAARPGENILSVRVMGGSPVSGIVGAVWFETERPAKEEIPLAGDWNMVKADYIESETVRLPGKVKGKYLSREMEVPASWKGQSIYIHVDTPAQWIGSVLVNGRPVNYNSYLHPFPLRAEINVSLLVKPGEKNTIELWPFQTTPKNGQAYPKTGGADSIPEVPMEITGVYLKRVAD